MFGIDDSRGFDLNIEKVLENWEVYHALREIIAKALDDKRLLAPNQLKYSLTSKVSGIFAIMAAGFSIFISRKKKMRKK